MKHPVLMWWLLMRAAAVPEAAADSLDQLSHESWTWRARPQPSNREDVPRLTRPAGWAPDWSRAAVTTSLSDLAGFERRRRALAEPHAEVAREVAPPRGAVTRCST